MTTSQITRFINWIAISVAIVLLAMVGYHTYRQHFLARDMGSNYQFDDLPSFEKIVLDADIDKIINMHLFGVVPKTPQVKPVAAKPPPAKAAPKTKLDIRLSGIINGPTPESGLAMLEVKRGRTLVVSVGEKIGKTGAILHQVLPGEILIDRDGTLESVKMVRKTLNLSRPDRELFQNLPQPYVEPPQSEQKSSQPTDQDTATIKKRKGLRERMPPMKKIPIPPQLSGQG